jgi:hypothetical protein
MSGYKYTKVVIDRSRQQRIERLREVAKANQQVKGIAAKISGLLNSTHSGLKSTFNDEVRRAEEWARGLSHSLERDIDASATLNQLDNNIASLTTEISKGKSILERLATTFNQKADAMEKSALLRHAVAESALEGHKELLKNWYGQGVVLGYAEEISGIQRLIDQKQLAIASNKLDKLERQLISQAAQAEEKEIQHQKRVYVLGALRQVCRDLGFQETEPQFEENDRCKSIVYQVDTMDQGKIIFRLTLEGVSADSQISETKCLNEFSQMSKLLDENFGVKTNFGQTEQKPDVIKIAKGEMDLPGGNQAQRTA